MFTIDDPEIGSDELSRRVREEARRLEAERGRPGGGERCPDAESARSWAAAYHAVALAEQYCVVGEALPPMSTIRGFKRRIVVPIAKLILRAARLVTREQTSFNVEAVRSLRALADAVALDVRGVESRLARALEEQRAAFGALAEELGRHRKSVEERLTDVEHGARRGAPDASSGGVEQR